MEKKIFLSLIAGLLFLVVSLFNVSAVTNNSISFYGDANLVDGVFNFDGDGDYVELNNSNDYFAEDLKTIALWVRFNDLSDNGLLTGASGQEIFSKSKHSKGLEILIYMGELRFYVMGENETGGRSESYIGLNISNISVNEWHFIVAKQDGPNSTMSFYVDNVLIGNATTPVVINNSAEHIILGSWSQPLPYAYGGKRFFNGSLTNILVFNETLEENETDELFDLNVTGVYTGDLGDSLFEDTYLVDSDAPVFEFIPENVSISEGTSFSVDFNATDNSSFSWEVNNSYFSIDENGTLTNNGVVPAGVYLTLVTAKDIFNNSNSVEYLITITPIEGTISLNSGGGGGYCTTQWTCSEWSDCTDETQTRTCSYRSNFCTPRDSKPIESQECVVENVELNKTEETQQEVPQVTNPFTAAVIGTTGGKIGLGIVSFLILLGAGYGFVAYRKKKGFKKSKKVSKKK